MKIILKKFTILLLCIAAAGLILVAAVNIYITGKTEKMIYPQEKYGSLPHDADCIIVLGAGLKDDGTPNHMLRDRLDAAIALYKNGICQKLLLSGDHGSNSYDEVNAMKNYAMEHGVDERHIYLDHAGFSTYDSIKRASSVFGVKKAIIITQKYHLYRALYIADAVGIDSYGVNSDPYVYTGEVRRNVREVLARFKDYFAVMFDVKPKYLGERIDINVSASEETYG